MLWVSSLSPGFALGIADEIIHEQKENIQRAAEKFHISPRLLASIIYAERTLNERPGRDVVDMILARTGYNSSLGIAQVKVGTGIWIEEQLNNPDGPVYLGANRASWIVKSQSREELIERLADPKRNLLYASAYAAMIIRLWHPILSEPNNSHFAAGLIATLYSLGIERADGSLRMPHANSALNEFGRAAQRYYDGFPLF